MWLMLAEPVWASRSCDDCEKYIYGENGDRRETKISGVSLPLLRPSNAPTPCYKCPKIPKGQPLRRQSAIELTDRNYAAWQHYRECRAVGQFPDDAIVRRNAGELHEVCETFAQSKNDRLMALLEMMVAVGGVAAGGGIGRR